MKRLLLLALLLSWADVAEAAEQVAVRAAPHGGYGRIVFDWKTPVEHVATVSGRTLTVRFARPLTANLDLVRDRLPDHIESIRVEPNGQTVVARLKGDYSLRPSSDRGIVILDLVESGNGTQTRAAPKTEPAAGPVAEKPAKPDALDEAVNRVLKPTPLVPQPPAAAAKASEGAPFVSVDVTKGRDISTLRFNWRTEVGAAVFRGRGQIWVVFDAPARIELASLRVNGAPIVTGVDQVAVPGASAVRLAIDSSRHARVRRDGTVWIIEILDAHPASGKAIDVTADSDTAGGRVVLGVKGPGRVVRLQDPEVGDTIQVVTVVEPGLGVPEPRRFVDVEVLESQQGAAVRPLADQVFLEIQANDIVVTRPGGLRVSREAERVRRASDPSRGERLYDFAAWSKGPSESFAASQQELIRRAAGAERADLKRKARLTLARFYLGNGFGPEALGVIREIGRTDAGKTEDIELRALRGAARVLSGDYAFANDDFKHPALEMNAETAPWRATIAAARGDWKTAQQQFRELEAVFETYPSWLAARIGLLAIEASLAIGDTGAGAARVEALGKRNLSAADRDALNVMRGYLQKLSGDVDGAVATWREMAGSADRKNQARARYALTNALLERKEISVGDAIERMERLRYAWRGDVHEFDLLRRLAQLYTDRGDNRRALQTLKEAATYFREIEGVQTVAQDMATTFHRLFAEGGADQLPSVTALGLFDEFRELTPTGEEGDQLVRRFAERLASVDLLDEAARLLEQQVKLRLKGEEKARIGLRAAELRLADRKPEVALTALADSTIADLPAALTHDRLLAQARALAALDKRDEALAAIASEKDSAAERLRASIYWRAKAWRPAAESFGRLIDEGDVPAAEVAGLVLSRAVALALAGDEKELDALRAKQGEMMKKSPYADAFNAVARSEGGAARDFRAASRVADEIAALQAIVGSQRRAAGQAQTQAIN